MKLNRKTWIFGILVLCMTVFIFANSMKNGSESQENSAAVIGLLAPVLDALGGFLGIGDWTLVVRKGAHMAEFAALAALIFLFVCFFRQDTGKSLLGYGLFYALSTAVCDEFIQLYSPGRTGKVTDVLIDAAGASIGFLITWLIMRLVRSRKV